MMSHPSAIISLNELDMNHWKVGGGIGHAKEHDSGFVEFSVGNEGSLPLVAFLDSDIVISPSYVNLVKTLVSLSLSMRSEIKGRGYAS